MKQKIALALSGGGARGIAHIGVIEELEERGYEITSIAGTSMGSLIGGAYATGKMQALKEWIYTLDKSKVFRMVDFTLSRQGLIKADKVMNKMKDYVPDVRIEELELPYAAVAVDMLSRKEVVFREGSLYHAIRASIAIPGIIIPVKEDHRLLVDGGVLDNIPMAHVERNKGDILVAVHVNADVPMIRKESKEEKEDRDKQYLKRVSELYRNMREKLPSIKRDSSQEEDHLGYFSMITGTFDLMTLRMAEDKIRQFKPDILVNVSREACNVYDFYKAEQQVEEGRRAAQLTLDAL